MSPVTYPVPSVEPCTEQVLSALFDLLDSSI